MPDTPTEPTETTETETTIDVDMTAPGYPDAELVANAVAHAAAALKPHQIGDRTTAFIVPDGYRLETIDETAHEDQPRYVEGSFPFVGSSFVPYVRTYREEHLTTLHAIDITDPVKALTEATVAMVAVFDDHPADRAFASNRRHRASLVMRPTPEAKRWGHVLNRPLGQEELLDVVTDGVAEIVDPDAAELRDFVAHLHASRSVDVESVIRTGGEGTIKLSENVKLRSGAVSSFQFPETITVRFTPFVFADDDALEFTIRVKAAINETTHRVSFSLSAASLERDLLGVLDKLVQRTSDEIGMPAWWRPTSSV